MDLLPDSVAAFPTTAFITLGDPPEAVALISNKVISDRVLRSAGFWPPTFTSVVV